MFSLDPRSRAAFAGAGACCFAIAIATSPLQARGEAPSPMSSLAVAAPPAPMTVPALDIRRDPFVGDIDDVVAGRSGVARNDPAPLPAPAVVPLPPNIPGVPIPAVPEVPQGRVAAFSGWPSISAIVTGGRIPHAVINEPQGVRIVHVDDRIDGARIIAIDLNGLTLEGGRRLSLGTTGVGR